MGTSCSEERKNRDMNRTKSISNRANILNKNLLNNTSNNSILRSKTLNTNYNSNKFLSQFKNIKEEINTKIEYNWDLIFEEQKNDFQKLYNLMNDTEYEYNTFKESYYLVNKNWIENCTQNKKLLEVKIKYNISNEILYPSDFQIIKEEILNKILLKDSKFELKCYLLLIIKGYILIKDIDKKTKNILFFVCPLKDNSNLFNVDFIFSFKQLENDLCYNYIKNKIIEDKSFEKKERNKSIYFYKKKDEKNTSEKNELIGFYICFPFNIQIIKKKKKVTYYDLNKIYERFIHSINTIQKIKNEEIEGKTHIKNIIQKIIPVFILRKELFISVLKEIYFDEYIKNNNEKKPLSKKITNDIENNKKLISLLNDIELSKKECIFESSICLINKEFCKALKINLSNKEKYYLLLINENYFLYFKKDKSLMTINKDKVNNNIYKSNNFWKAINYVNNNDNENINYNINNIENIINTLSENPNKEYVKLLINLYCNELFLKNKIKSKEISCLEKIKLINKEWLNRYKVFNNYQEIISSIEEYIEFSEININDINAIIENIYNNIECFIPKININTDIPEFLKNLEKSKPKMSNNELFIFPINFEFIKNEIFMLLIKDYEQNNNIENNNNICDCLFGNGDIIIYDANNPCNLYIYSIDDYKNDKIQNYKIKYIFQFMNSSIAKNEMNFIKNVKNLENYLNNNSLDSKKYGKQNFTKGNFYNFIKEDKVNLGILLYKKPTLIGLENIGATCYMNATLQCLSNIDILTDFFLIYEDIIMKDCIKYILSFEYTKLIKNLWDENKEKKYYAPYDFKNKIGEMNPLFRGIAANDSKDLILFIFEELHKELNIPNINNLKNNTNNPNNIFNNIPKQINEKEEYDKFKIDYYNQNHSIIQEIFYGEQESFSLCHNCKTKIFNFSIFSFLIFPLEKVRLYLITKNPNGFYKVTLEDCFEQYISEEIMAGENQMYCNYCHRNSNYSMCNKIYKHPEVLCIILNRGKGLEFDVEFEYPRNIKINNYINLKDNSNYNNNENIEYELISIITHLGDSSMAGHFIAYCKSPIDKKWYLYNDATVSESNYHFDDMNNSELKSVPYVLFYQIKFKRLNTNQKDYPFPNIQSSNNLDINNNINFNNNSNINQITLYFNFPNQKELYLDIDENIIFNDAISFLIQKYNLELKDYKFFKESNSVIDGMKSIKNNLLKNEEHIKVVF